MAFMLARYPMATSLAVVSDSSSQQTITAINTPKVITFDTIEALTPGFGATNAGLLTIPVTSYYLVTASIQFRVSSATATTFRLFLYQAGAQLAKTGVEWTLTANVQDYKMCTVFWVVSLAAQDTLQLGWASSTTVGTITTNPATSAKPSSPGATLVVGQLPYASQVLVLTSSSTQATLTATTTAAVMSFNNPADINVGFTVTTTRATVVTAGTYSASWSAQVRTTTACSITVWVRINGVDLALSAAENTVPLSDGKIMTRTYTLPLAVGDYVELWWRATNVAARITATAAGSLGPLVPSARLTLHRIT